MVARWSFLAVYLELVIWLHIERPYGEISGCVYKNIRMHDIVCRMNEHFQPLTWLLCTVIRCGNVTFRGTRVSFNDMEVCATTLTWTAPWKERGVQVPPD